MHIRLLTGVSFCFVCVAMGETATGIFEDLPPAQHVRPPEPAPKGPDIKKLDQEAMRLRFVPGATRERLCKKWDDALKTLDAAIDEAAASGDTAKIDALRSHRESVVRATQDARKSPMPPSLYPLDVGKKGSLYAVRESELTFAGPAAAGGEPLKLTVEVISWFRVKFLSARDGGLLCEIYENSGKVLLYKALLTGVDNPALSPGVSAELINVGFEITAAEQTDEGMLYHLKKIPAEALGPAK